MNFEEEIIDGHLVSSTTKQLWAVEMDMAQRIIDVCNKYKLRIWAEGGTLLGVVRHQGFIPWDDDMDFVMFRDDFEKLKEIGPEEFGYPYFFQSNETDNIESYAVRIRRSDTTFITKTDPIWTDRNLGVFIDIFVLDAVPNNDLVFKKDYKRISLLHRILSNVLYLNVYKARRITRIIHYILKIYIGIIGESNIQLKIDSLLKRNDISRAKDVALIDLYAVLQKDLCKVAKRNKSWYDETVMLPFIDMQLPVPKDYHKILTAIYGDYMTPVKGSSLHTILKIDCKRSYKDVIAELNDKRRIDTRV